MRDYQIVSPSLEGVLNHDSLLYDGVNRPIELLRVLDGPKSKGRSKEEIQKISQEECLTLERYFQDLYGVFVNKLSIFSIEPYSDSDEIIKMQALLQEMIKVKKLIALNQ